ncbi:hypothetical protein FKP32DRAFT_100105 [Trametes sanguinea]|nr:hypothetical protein FKP32DRAFT_100105 [Trametes sanguinea]
MRSNVPHLGFLLMANPPDRTLSTLNVLHMALTLLAYTQEYIAVSYIPAFNSPITSILVSRFLLNLRQVDRVSANPMGSEQPSFVDPQAREPFAEFASFVAPLHDIAEDDLSLRWNVSASAGSSAGAGSASGVEPADSGESHGEDEGPRRCVPCLTPSLASDCLCSIDSVA